MTYTLLDDLPSSNTPRDYLRVHFDHSALPKKRIVGFLACQQGDPLLSRLRTRIVSCQPASLTTAPPQGKAKKKGYKLDTPSEAATPTGTLWEVQTEDTVVFPEGGGQPCDTGTLQVVDSQCQYVIEACLRRGLEAVHLVRVPDGEPSLDGLEGQEVELSVDWVRRRDHMTIHTAQHLLSAVLDTYSLNTLSWGMSSYASIETPYIELPRALTWAEAQEVEGKCNALINQDKKVWIDVSVQSEKVNDEGARETRGIPKDYQGGVIRHCVIDGIDRNACCGTQCPSLGHCEMIHVLPPPTPSGSSTPSSLKPTRLFFTAGPRAQRYLIDASRQLSLAAQAANCGRTDLSMRIAKNEELRKDANTQWTALRIELLGVEVEKAVAQGQVAWIQREQKSTHDFEFMSGVASGYLERQPEGIAIATSSLSGVPPSLLVVQSRGDKAKEIFDKLKKALEGNEKGRVKGGGAKGRFMAKVDGKWGKAELGIVQSVIDDLRAASSPATPTS